MYKPSPGAAGARTSILGTLRAADMSDVRPVLPAEILATILDYLPIPDLMRVARTSRRMREMVYDDTRWVARLRSIGCWDEVEARRRFEEAVRRRREAIERTAVAHVGPAGAPGQRQPSQQPPPQQQGSTTIFDAAAEQERRKRPPIVPVPAPAPVPEVRVSDGFETAAVGAAAKKEPPANDETAVLDVIKNSKSVRGYARMEYGKIYGALAPFYYDLVEAKSHADPLVFKVFRDPERQGQMLANLQSFARSDWASGWQQREEKLSSMVTIFEGAVLREFEQGYEFWDVDGRMRRYAHVLHTLGASSAGVDLFIAKHPIFSDREVVSANAMDCINQASYEEITLEPSRLFFDMLLTKVNEQAGVMERIFPEPAAVFWQFVDKIREDVVMEYATPLFDELHERSMASYLKAVSGLFEQGMHFFRQLAVPKGLKEKQEAKANEMMLKIFEPHLDLYLQEELDFFTKHAETEVGNWEKKLSDEDASAESFYMGNFNQQADKKDFLNSFKKVVMMPVTVLPSLPLPSLSMSLPFGTSSKPTTAPAPAMNGAAQPSPATNVSPNPSRPQTPGLGVDGNAAAGRRSPLPDKAPTDELAAKAALMASRLEGIKSLFSIEMALNLVHAAKASLGRAAVFIRLGGQAGEEAREQCETIFVVLLRILGQRHVRNGFEKAVDHLGHYNARTTGDHSENKGVAPLVTFIELVNVGDLISQMIDVFYEQQLAGPKIVDRNDFLDPAGLAKKKFEQMLDESVAAGLNKGIDVLMDEVEYLMATTQLPTDYNPAAPEGDQSSQGGADSAAFAVLSDPGPTPTAVRIVDLVGSHTRMLVGSTEKTMLDVFNGEVGLRLFTAVTKHLKRQRVSTAGAIKLIADSNLYFDYVRGLRNQDLLAYFSALRELSQIYLIDAKHAREMATVIADGDRFRGIFRAEEVYEFAQRRADWYQVRKDVERAMYGLECLLM